MTTLTNLENALKLNVNIYEIENSILNGDKFFKTHDYTFFIIESETDTFNNYNELNNECLLNTNNGKSYLIKKI